MGPKRPCRRGAVLLLGTGQAQADAAAQRLVEAVAQTVLPLPLPVPRTVAITVGVAHLDRPSVDDTPPQIVALADAQLNGRKVQLERVRGDVPGDHHPAR